MLVVKQDIIERINRGDAKAFEQLYSAYYVYLCAVATKFIYHAEAAREVVNDVFLNVWNNHKSLVYPVNAYLLRSVQNRCLNYLRQQRLQEVPLSDVQDGLLYIQEQQVGAEPHPLASLENKEFEETVSAAIDRLPKKCRDIFVQYLYYNKSYDEIAKESNIATSTVRVQVKIGLTKLKGILGELYPIFLLMFNFIQK